MPDAKSPDHLLLRICSRFKCTQPVRQAVMESGNRCECALLGGRIGKIADPLRAKCQGLIELDVPVQIRTWKRPVPALKRMKTTMVRRHPKIGTTSKLGKGLMDARAATIHFQSRMLDQLDHNAVLHTVIPRMRRIRLCTDIVPNDPRRFRPGV